MNDLVFNNTAEQLNAAYYGLYQNSFLPVAVDADGMILLSPINILTVTASNLDIRNLDYQIDSVTITATDLDIRTLSGATDSVAVSSLGFTEDNATQTVPSGTTYLLTKDISPYSENSYYIRNTGGGTITVTVQISPVDDNNYYINHTTAQGVPSGSNAVAAVTIPMKYARLSVLSGANVGVVAYYNGRA